MFGENINFLNFLIMKKVFYFIFLSLGVSAMFTSCSKEDNSSAIEPTIFSRSIQIFDTNGGNSVEIKLSSKDENLLAEYSQDNFELIPIMEGQSSEEAIKQYYGEDATSTGKEEADIEDVSNNIETPIDFPTVSFDILSQNLQVGVRGVAVTFKHPDAGEKSKWKYYWHYSAAGQGLEQTASITRTNGWRRVFFGLSYRAYSNSSWSEIISDYKKLHNNENYTANRNPCYQFRFHVKTKKQSAYTVSFTY